MTSFIWISDWNTASAQSHRAHNAAGKDIHLTTDTLPKVLCRRFKFDVELMSTEQQLRFEITDATTGKAVYGRRKWTMSFVNEWKWQQDLLR